MNCCGMISIGFRVLLLLVTAGLLVNCAIRYIQNHSTASIDYKRYHVSAKDLYPSHTFCFTGLAIYDGKKLQQTYGIDNAYDYAKFLSGDIWNDTMINVDYDYVTDHLSYFFNEIAVALDILGNRPAYRWVNQVGRSNRGYEREERTLHTNESFPFYISQRTAYTKCFTFDISKQMPKRVRKKLIRRFEVTLNVSKALDVSSSLSLHYPGQITRAIPMYSDGDKNRGVLSGNISAKVMDVGVTEVIRRRESAKQSCNPDSAKTDELMYKKMAQTLDCKPAHWTAVNYPNICNSTETMKKSNFADATFVDPGDLEHIDPPCDELQDVNVGVSSYSRGSIEADASNLIGNNSQSASILVLFTRAIYREITHARSYDFEGLIGNGGGYVGLFLGFAIWQIPDFCDLVYNSLSQKWIMV